MLPTIEPTPDKSFNHEHALQTEALRAVTMAGSSKEKLGEWTLMLMRLREPGEDLMDTSTRLLLTEAVTCTRNYAEAARLLGLTGTNMSLSVRFLRLLKRFAPAQTSKIRKRLNRATTSTIEPVTIT